jgi:hypothetical protein
LLDKDDLSSNSYRLFLSVATPVFDDHEEATPTADYLHIHLTQCNIWLDDGYCLVR